MAFNENVLNLIVDKISDIIDENEPITSYFLIKKLLKIFNHIPEYPELIPDMLENALTKIDINQLEKDDLIMVDSGKDKFLGIVKEITESQELKLREIYKTISYKSKTLSSDKIDNICCLNDKDNNNSQDNNAENNIEEGGSDD
jgi:hypothetical protein